MAIFLWLGSFSYQRITHKIHGGSRGSYCERSAKLRKEIIDNARVDNKLKSGNLFMVELH